MGRDNSVSIATGYGLDGPGIESWWGGEIFRTCPDRPWGPTSLLYKGYRVFPGVKSRRSVPLTPHPLLVPWSWKGRAIPLLPLWAVRPAQSLRACTRVHFIFFSFTCNFLTLWPLNCAAVSICFNVFNFCYCLIMSMLQYTLLLRYIALIQYISLLQYVSMPSISVTVSSFQCFNTRYCYSI